jgi:hypothetical protein
MKWTITVGEEGSVLLDSNSSRFSAIVGVYDECDLQIPAAAADSCSLDSAMFLVKGNLLYWKRSSDEEDLVEISDGGRVQLGNSCIAITITHFDHSLKTCREYASGMNQELTAQADRLVVENNKLGKITGVHSHVNNGLRIIRDAEKSDIGLTHKEKSLNNEDDLVFHSDQDRLALIASILQAQIESGSDVNHTQSKETNVESESNTEAKILKISQEYANRRNQNLIEKVNRLKEKNSRLRKKISECYSQRAVSLRIRNEFCDLHLPSNATIEFQDDDDDDLLNFTLLFEIGSSHQSRFQISIPEQYPFLPPRITYQETNVLQFPIQYWNPTSTLNYLVRMLSLLSIQQSQN